MALRFLDSQDYENQTKIEITEKDLQQIKEVKEEEGKEEEVFEMGIEKEPN
jgi:hypothetical protein